MPRYLLGIDGGQTATTAAVCDGEGHVLGLGRAGPANHVWEPGGAARARRAVRTSIAGARRAAGLGRVAFEAAFLGISGATQHTLAAVQNSVPAKRLRLENDRVNALASVTAGKPGLVVIAGTGVMAYGETARGRTAFASGWGYLLGDEGGGFWITRQGIAAACRAHDGRGEETALTKALTAAVGAADMWDLHRLVYSGELARADLAGLAAVVQEVAAGGDIAARRILGAAGRELGLAAGSVAGRLGMERGRPIVGMVGGVFGGSELVRSSFRREVRRHVPKAVFAEPRFAPVIGAVLLALKMIGVPITRRVLAELGGCSPPAGSK